MMRFTTQKGMTLLEILVAMLVVGIAMVGSISMIQASMRYTQHANNQSMALYAAQEIIGRIRANPTAVDTYLKTDKKAAKGAADCFATADCADPQKVALSDMRAWWQDIEISLPCPMAEIKFLGDGSRVSDGDLHLYAVTVNWLENHRDDENSRECEPKDNAKIMDEEHLNKLVVPFSL